MSASASKPRINYFLPFTAHTGGVAVIFEQVRRLADRGYEATVTVPNSQLPVGWTSPEHVTGVNSPEEIVDADIVVATASQSGPLVLSLPPSKGEKFYLVQHYESLWVGNVDETYRSPMKKIVVSTWLKDVMAESFGQPSIVVPPAIDHDVFRPDGERRPSGRRRVLVMDHALRILKGTWVALRAVELARRRLPGIELVVFGTRPRPDGLSGAEVHAHPTGERLAELYRSCDIFLFPTVAEGFGLPPLEAMACGTAVITTDHTGTADFANDRTCFIAPVHDVAATAEALVDALTNDERRIEVAEAGRAKAAEFTWDATVDRLEEAFTTKWWEQPVPNARRTG